MKMKNSDPVFTARQFKPTEFDSAQDKADFANYFIRFVRSDYNRNLFTKKFYNRLSHCFGHIAHYNLAGFYEVWFSSLHSRYGFLCGVTQHVPCGDPAFTYCDVERELKAWIEKSEALYQAKVAFHQELEKKERAELDRLIQKYGRVTVRDQTNGEVGYLYVTQPAQPGSAEERT